MQGGNPLLFFLRRVNAMKRTFEMVRRFYVLRASRFRLHWQRPTCRHEWVQTREDGDFCRHCKNWRPAQWMDIW
jgi:hypothetical protein